MQRYERIHDTLSLHPLTLSRQDLAYHGLIKRRHKIDSKKKKEKACVAIIIDLVPVRTIFIFPLSIKRLTFALLDSRAFFPFVTRVLARVATYWLQPSLLFFTPRKYSYPKDRVMRSEWTIIEAEIIIFNLLRQIFKSPSCSCSRELLVFELFK